MKYYKIKVQREPLRGGGTHYVYPAGFHELKYWKIHYEGNGDPAAVEARDRAYEYVLIETTDTEKVQLIDCEEVVKKDALILKEKWTPIKTVSPIIP